MVALVKVNRKCDNCGIDVEIAQKERLNHKNIFCCKKCEGEFRRKNNPNWIPCLVCGKPHYVKPRDQKKITQGSCCSRECLGILRSQIYHGENNPNFGNKGRKNPIWKSDTRISQYGYILVRREDHPFKNCDGFVFEHRLVAEQYLLTPETTIIINGKKYLSPDYIVHHKDHNRKNNDVSNLEIMTLSQHMHLHQQERKELAS